MTSIIYLFAVFIDPAAGRKLCGYGSGKSFAHAQAIEKIELNVLIIESQSETKDDVSCNDSHAPLSIVVGEKFSFYDMFKDNVSAYESTKYG